MDTIRTSIHSAVARLLRPLVRVLLRNGIPYGAVADMAKRVYVDVAGEEFGIEGRKLTVSRVSVITGLSRKEVSRLRGLPVPDDSEFVDRYNRAARVITGWTRDEAFLDEMERTRDLEVESEDGGSFSDLVRKYSGDVPHRAILDELLRVRAAEMTGDGRVRLLERAYMPRTGEEDKIGILGIDTADLIATIDHNIYAVKEGAEPFFQRKVSYDNLPEQALPELREMTRDYGQRVLEYLDRWLSARDRDVNPAAEGSGRVRAGVGVYYFEEGSEEDRGDER